MILDKICDIAVLGSRYIPFEQLIDLNKNKRCAHVLFHRN